MDTNSLAHSRYNCKYHIVFAPKFRRMKIYGALKCEIGKILRQLCAGKRKTSTSSSIIKIIDGFHN